MKPETTDKATYRTMGLMVTAVIFLVLIIDQLIKFEVKTHLHLFESIEIMPWCQINFTENSGMAFGMEFTGTWILAIFRFIAILFFCFVLHRLIRRGAKRGFIFCIALIVGGALGNIVDNCFYGLIYTESLPAYMTDAPAQLVSLGNGYGTFLSGRVVDMFYFPLFVWPDWMPILAGKTFFGAIFNFADACVSVGAIALILFYPRLIFGGTKETESQDAETPQ